MPDGPKLIVAIKTVIRLKGYTLKIIIVDVNLYNLFLFCRIFFKHNMKICVEGFLCEQCTLFIPFIF